MAGVHAHVADAGEERQRLDKGASALECACLDNGTELLKSGGGCPSTTLQGGGGPEEAAATVPRGGGGSEFAAAAAEEAEAEANE